VIKINIGNGDPDCSQESCCNSRALSGSSVCLRNLSVNVAVNFKIPIFGSSLMGPPKETGNRDESHGFVHSK
jgi:hypothetical protein